MKAIDETHAAEYVIDRAHTIRFRSTEPRESADRTQRKNKPAAHRAINPSHMLGLPGRETHAANTKMLAGMSKEGMAVPVGDHALQ